MEQSPQQPNLPSWMAQISDEELTKLALAADTSVALGPHAVAWDGATLHKSGLLPDWYMPTPVGVRSGRWPRFVVIGLTVGFLLINAAGLCVTSGFISFT